jgi:ABC-type glutathione transport system ATPase component
MIYNIEIKKSGRTLVRIEDFQIQDQAVNFLFGESGIGKTMIARAIYGLLQDEEFAISINGQPYAVYLQSPEFQLIPLHGFFVFQEPSSHLNPLLKIRQQLREGSLIQSDLESEILSNLWPERNNQELDHILDIYPRPYRPSGGEKQRILMTMAFKKIEIYLRQIDAPPTMFIFDEPTGNLDNTHRNLFLHYLMEKYLRRQHNFTILFITHDYSIIGEMAQKYPELQQRLSFTDLQLTPQGLKQQNFSVQKYLDWHDGIKTLAVPAERVKTPVPVLKVESRFTIFNRNLVITKDSQAKMETALEIYPGEMIYLKAGSGVGKTSLVKGILGLLPADRMQLCLAGITFNEKTLGRYWRRRIWGKKATMVFQHADEALNLNARVKDVFKGLPLPGKMNSQRLIQQLQWIFNTPIDAGFLKRKISSLSGGQKQRLNLLRSLVLDTDLLILDEPLNGLGFESIQKVLDLLQEKQSAGKGLLLISHNEDIFDKLIPPAHTYYLNISS